jgi:hypothetical protein
MTDPAGVVVGGHRSVFAAMHACRRRSCIIIIIIIIIIMRMQGRPEPEHIALPQTSSSTTIGRSRKTEFEKLKQICHPGVDKSRSPAVLAKLEELSKLPPREFVNLDPYSRRGAAWRVDETMNEIGRMNEKITELKEAGMSRRKLRDGRQRNSTDRTLDPKGSLPEMMEEARLAIGS